MTPRLAESVIVGACVGLKTSACLFTARKYLYICATFVLKITHSHPSCHFSFSSSILVTLICLKCCDFTVEKKKKDAERIQVFVSTSEPGSFYGLCRITVAYVYETCDSQRYTS